MKNLKLLLFGMVFLLAVSLTYALPEISYTNFARTAGGGLVLSGNVDVRITILEGSSQLYQETHAGIATNEFGLFTVKLGEGTPVGPDTYNGLLAKSTLNIKAESNDGGGYRFIELSALLSTALKNEEAAAAVSLNDAYITGNEIEVAAGFPVDLKGTGLIQSAASVADINANGDATLTTKKYVDDAVAAILPLDPLTVNEGLQMTPGPSYDGTAAQVVGIAPKAITNAKIADATEFLAVAALGDGGVAGADAGTVSLTNLTHTLNFQGVGETNVTRTGNTILIDGADNWGSQVVETDATLVGDGTTLNKLGINVDNSNAWNADQLLPATLAQGNNLIAAIEAGTPYSMDIDVLATGAAGQVFNSTGAANQWSNLNDAVASDIDFFANTDVTALDLQIKDGTVGNTEINDATVFVEVTGNGTPFDVTDGNPVLNFTGNSITSITLDDATNTVHIESAVATEAPITGDGTSTDAIGLDYDATLELNAGKLGIDLDHKNTWTVTQSFVPAANEPGIVLNGGTNNSAVLVANGFGYFENTKTTSAAFAVQGSAYGQTPNLGDLPVVAQGLTGVSAYTGAAPTTNMAIGTVGLGVSGNGAIAIGVYGGSRNNNPVANVGTVGHALNDNVGNDVNHGILGLISTASVPQDEITYLMTTPLNSAITGINLGVNANDFAGYFHGKVKSTGTIEGTLLIGALDKKIEEGAGIANFMFNNSADAIVALDYNYANEWFVTQTFSDIIVNNNTMTGSLDVDTDAMVGGDVTAGGMFIGALEHNITNGDGVASFTFDNTGDAVVAFDYGFENHWTANQTFDEVTILGGTIDGALIGSIDAEEGTFTNLEYTGTFTTPLTPMGVPFIGVAGELTEDAANFYYNASDLNLAGTMYIGTNLDVMVDATVGGDLDVTGDITGNDITAGGMFIGALEHNITNGDGVASFTFDNTGDAVVAFDYGFENHWTANQTFDEVTILSGAIDNTVIGANTPDAGTFTNLEGDDLLVNNDAAISGSLSVGILTETDYLDVLSDATVGGNLGVGGDVTATTFIGALENPLTNGPGIVTFSYNNSTAGIQVEVDYDATLEITGNQLGIDLDHENSWTVNQEFALVDINGGTIDGTTIGATVPANGTFTNVTVKDGAGNTNFVIGASTTEDAGWAKLFTDAGNEIVILGTTGVNGSRAGAVSVTDVNGWGPGVPIYGAGMYNDPISGNWIVGAGQLDLSIGAAIFSDATGTASFSIMNSGVVFNADQDGDVMLTNDLTVGNDASVGNDLSVEGNTILGTNATNTVVFNGLVDSDIIPDENNVHSLGTDALRWMDVYVGPASLHVGESGNEGIIGFNTGLSQFTFDQNVEIDADLFVNNNIYGTEIYGTVFNGGFTVPGAILFADASGNIVEDTDGDFYFDNSNPLFEVLYVPNLSTTELNATGNVIFDQDLVVAGSVTINDYTLPLADGAAGQLVTTDGAGNLGWTGVIDAINGATGNATFDGLTGTTQTPLAIHDDLNGDLFITKNYLEDYLFNADELSFSGLVLFNAGSGPAIEATSSDATSPTVTIENTNSQGVALELVGAAPQTTALEISTGGLNIANGQLIVSSNSGVGGGDPNGPTITVNNNGDGVDENGGAIQIVMGHTAFSFNKYTPAANAAVNLAKEPYTVYEIVSNGGSGNSITLPNGDVAADNLGTIIYIINSGASTLTLPGGLGTVAAGQSAKLVQISTGWFRLN